MTLSIGRPGTAQYWELGNADRAVPWNCHFTALVSSYGSR
jgi:hypothetical protein